MRNLQTIATALAIASIILLGLYASITYGLYKYKQSIRKEVLTEISLNTERVINDIADKSERSRTLFHYCVSIGLRYDLAKSKCS